MGSRTAKDVVLVGVDESEGARTALRWGAVLADQLGYGLRVVSAWSYPASAGLPGAPSLRPPEEMDQTVLAQIRQVVADEIGTEPDEQTVVVERGGAERAILSMIRPETRLVVVGKRGLGTLEGRVLGSVSRRIAELSPVPVAVVPAGTPPNDGPLVVGVDGSKTAAAARDWAIDTARATGVEVVLVHGISGLPAELPPSAIDRFVQQANEMVDELAAPARAAGLEVRTVVQMVDPRILLRSVSDEVSARMIVIGATGEGPAGGLLVGSVVSHVAQQSDRPVVIVTTAA